MQFCTIGSYEGTEYRNITLTGSGNGKYITNGKAIDITWKKPSEFATTQYFDSNGNEIVLNQGRTWVCIMDNASTDKLVIE